MKLDNICELESMNIKSSIIKKCFIQNEEVKNPTWSKILQTIIYKLSFKYTEEDNLSDNFIKNDICYQLKHRPMRFEIEILHNNEIFYLTQ